MICKNMIHAVALQKMVLSIGRAFDESFSAHCPANCSYFVLAEHYMQQKIVIGSNRYHAEQLRRMVLPIQRPYEQS
jgi:hypothetical protein